MCNTPIFVCIRVYSWFTCCERLQKIYAGLLVMSFCGGGDGGS